MAAGFPHSQRLRNRGGHETRIADGRQGDQEGAIGKVINHVCRHLQAQAGFAGPAGAGEGEQADVFTSQQYRTRRPLPALAQ